MTSKRARSELTLILFLAALACGCANLNERPSLDASAMPHPARAYLYGRFQLDPESATQPPLFLQLTNMGTSEFMTIHFRNTPQQMYVVDVEPGQYEFTQLVSGPSAAMDFKVRTANLRLPPRVGFMGQPFDVEAGKAYYVGDWFGAVSRDVDFYVVFAKVKLRAGLYQIIYDYDASTSALRHLYPSLGAIETRPAWGKKDGGTSGLPAGDPVALAVRGRSQRAAGTHLAPYHPRGMCPMLGRIPGRDGRRPGLRSIRTRVEECRPHRAERTYSKLGPACWSWPYWGSMAVSLPMTPTATDPVARATPASPLSIAGRNPSPKCDIAIENGIESRVPIPWSGRRQVQDHPLLAAPPQIRPRDGPWLLPRRCS